TDSQPTIAVGTTLTTSISSRMVLKSRAGHFQRVSLTSSLSGSIQSSNVRRGDATDWSPSEATARTDQEYFPAASATRASGLSTLSAMGLPAPPRGTISSAYPAAPATFCHVKVIGPTPFSPGLSPRRAKSAGESSAGAVSAALGLCLGRVSV